MMRIQGSRHYLNVIPLWLSPCWTAKQFHICLLLQKCASKIVCLPSNCIRNLTLYHIYKISCHLKTL
jgi:hypothetical protein